MIIAAARQGGHQWERAQPRACHKSQDLERAEEKRFWKEREGGGHEMIKILPADSICKLDSPCVMTMSWMNMPYLMAKM